jgi:hypothetical protein
MTGAGVKDILSSFEKELKHLRGEDAGEEADDWEPPSIERIRRRMAEANK